MALLMSRWTTSINEVTLVIEGNQAGQAGSAFPEPMLAGSDSLAVLHVSYDDSQNDLLNKLCGHGGQTDRPVVPCILLSSLLVDGHHTGQPPLIQAC